MSYKSTLPEPLNKLLCSETGRPIPKVELSKSDMIHDAMAEMFARYPSNSFKWNWHKWRYECEIDGVKVYATLYEYRKSRRIRFHTPGVI